MFWRNEKGEHDLVIIDDAAQMAFTANILEKDHRTSIEPPRVAIGHFDGDCTSNDDYKLPRWGRVPAASHRLWVVVTSRKLSTGIELVDRISGSPGADGIMASGRSRSAKCDAPSSSVQTRGIIIDEVLSFLTLPGNSPALALASAEWRRRALRRYAMATSHATTQINRRRGEEAISPEFSYRRRVDARRGGANRRRYGENGRADVCGEGWVAHEQHRQSGSVDGDVC